MRGNFLLTALILLCGVTNTIFSQTEELKLNAEKIKMFEPYVQARYGLSHQDFQQWKSVNKLQYTKELWYFSESFYIKKNHLKDGVSMDAANIDISRYESFRKKDREFILVRSGFCDAIVLLPSNKLIYKP